MCLYSISFSFLQPVLPFLLSLHIYVFIYFYFHILKYFLQTALQSDSVFFDVFWASFSKKTMTYKIPPFLPVWTFDIKTKHSAFCCCTSQQWDLFCLMPISRFMPQEVPQLLQGVVDPESCWWWAVSLLWSLQRNHSHLFTPQTWRMAGMEATWLLSMLSLNTQHEPCLSIYFLHIHFNAQYFTLHKRIHTGFDTKLQDFCGTGEQSFCEFWSLTLDTFISFRIESGRSPGVGNGYLFQYSFLGNPMDRWAWWATVHGATKESDMTK